MGKKRGEIARRTFLGGAAAAGSFMIVPRHVIGQGYTPPSETVYLASIGAGGRPVAVINGCLNAGARIGALCDVDDGHASALYNRMPDVPKYKDFRVLLEKEKNIDGVIVGTPDHTHAVAALDAMRRGKPVYSEKPLAHSIAEVRAMMATAKAHGVPTQLGNQGHSSEHMRLFREWVEDGAIGTVTEIHAFCGSNYSQIGRLPQLKVEENIPDGLDWSLWIGPAKMRPYHKMYLPGSWRGWRDFGTGVIGDWVCHVVDPSFWTLDLGAPESVTAEPVGFDTVGHRQSFPSGSIVHYQFPAKGDRPAVKLTWFDGDKRPPRPPELEAGRDMPGIGAFVRGDKGVIMHGSHGAGGCIIVPNEKFLAYDRPEKRLPRSPGHQKEWILAIKGEVEACGSDFSYGGPLTEVAIIGAVAMLFPGETLRWDGVDGKFVNHDAANGLLDPYLREGWTL